MPNRRMIPEHFNANGEPKKRYSRFEAASAAMNNEMDYYECSFCGFWHLAKKEEKDNA